MVFEIEKARHGIRMSRKETLKYLLEGTAGAVAADHLLDDDDEVKGISKSRQCF